MLGEDHAMHRGASEIASQIVRLAEPRDNNSYEPPEKLAAARALISASSAGRMKPA